MHTGPAEKKQIWILIRFNLEWVTALCLQPWVNLLETKQVSVVQNLSLKQRFIRRCLRTRLRFAYATHVSAYAPCREHEALTRSLRKQIRITCLHHTTTWAYALDFFHLFTWRQHQKWKQTHVQIHGEVKLTHFAYAGATAKKPTQPYAIQVFAYAQSPYEHVLTKYEHLGFEQCSSGLPLQNQSGLPSDWKRLRS